MDSALQLVGGILFLAVLVVVGWRNVSKARRGDDDVEDAISRARLRYGRRRTGVGGTPVQRVDSHILVKLLAAIFIGTVLWMIGFIIYRWLTYPGHHLAGNMVIMSVIALLCAVVVADTATATLEIDDESIIFKSALSYRRLKRADVLGYRWVYRYQRSWLGRRVEQVLFDKAGRCYTISHVLKHRLPHDCWIWELEDLGDMDERDV
jgi:hypothetical protein